MANDKALDNRDREGQTRGLNPYVGPRSFNEEHSRYFFGRDEERRQLTSLVIAHRVVLFYAQSGAGKTSLLRASVLPELKRRKKVVVLPITRVGGDLPPGVAGDQVANIYVFNALLNLAGAGAETGAGFQPGTLAGVSLKEGLAAYLEPSTWIGNAACLSTTPTTSQTSYPPRHSPWNHLLESPYLLPRRCLGWTDLDPAAARSDLARHFPRWLDQVHP